MMGRSRPLVLIAVAAASAVLVGVAAGGGGPFVTGGDFEHWGAGGGHAGGSGTSGGTRIGCGITRHYVYALTVLNRSAQKVTLLDASAPDPAPRIIAPLATQIRRWHPPVGRGLTGSLVTKWSAARTEPLALRPREGAVVQANFVIRNCPLLTHGRTVEVPGKLTLRYRRSGRLATQVLTQPEVGFVLGAGPRFRKCRPPAGALTLQTSNLGCAVARAAAPVCDRHPDHGNFKPCSAAGHVWRCNLQAVFVERCMATGFPGWRYRPGYTAHWKPRKLH